MHFRTEKERREHPQAGLIPYCVWKEYFTSNFSEELCKLQQVSNDELFAYVDLYWVKKPVHEKRLAWLAIAFSHPNLHPQLLQTLAYKFQIDYLNSIELAFASGNKDYLKLMIGGASISEAESIKQSIKYGHVELLNYFIGLLPEKTAQELIATDDYSLFKYALSRGQIEVVKYLIAFVPQEKVQAIITENNYKVFECAAINSNLDLILYLANLCSEQQVQEILAANDYKILERAAWKGNLDLVRSLLISIPKEKVEEMIAANNYSAFQYAASGGHMDIMRELLANVSVATAQKMIAANNYSAFHHAITFKHIDTQHFLLDFPSVFKYAESNVWEFGACTCSYINKRLNDLRTLKQAFEQTFPAGGFDIPQSEIEKLFHYARHLILRNAPEHQEDLSFLLSIPAFKKRAHHSFNGGSPNELIRLAISLDNKEAYELLLTIPKVREETIAQKYYRIEQNDGIDLRDLAQQEESSMTCLTKGEQKRLEKAINHYSHLLIGKSDDLIEPFKDELSIGNNVLKPFKDELQKRYLAHPATFLGDDNTLFQLPLESKKCKELLYTLTDTERKRAYQAYSQHPEHTVIRFLSTPNPWIDSEAIFVNHHPKRPRDRWSAYEDFAKLIAILYYAAVDSNITPTDGFTLETRFTHFIHELMQIARAQNMKTRIVLDAAGHQKKEEYDDLKGDKPPCSLGIKRRLLQAVLGHPLLQLLTEDVLEQLLQEFIKNHFQSQINSSNQAVLLEELEACVHLEKTDHLQLKALDVTRDQQQEFIESLKNKYVKKFDLSLEEYVLKRFSLTEHGIDHICHALKFAGTISLKSLLTKEMKLQEPVSLDLEQAAETVSTIQIAGTISESLVNPDEQFNSSSFRFFRAPISRDPLQEEPFYIENMNSIC